MHEPPLDPPPVAMTRMLDAEPSLTLRLACDERDLRAAQRLRYEVFVEELGARGPGVDHVARLEQDEFDPHFEHLLLIDTRRDPALLQDVVGAYRLLPPERVAAAGRLLLGNRVRSDRVAGLGAAAAGAGPVLCAPRHAGWGGDVPFVERTGRLCAGARDRGDVRGGVLSADGCRSAGQALVLPASFPPSTRWSCGFRPAPRTGWK